MKTQQNGPMSHEQMRKIFSDLRSQLDQLEELFLEVAVMQNARWDFPEGNYSVLATWLLYDRWRNNAVLRWRLSEQSNWAIDTLLRVVSRWRIFATQAHISRDEQERMAGAVYDENVTILNLCRFFVTLRQFVHVRVERCAFPRSLYVRHHEDRQVPPELADVLNTSE